MPYGNTYMIFGNCWLVYAAVTGKEKTGRGDKSILLPADRAFSKSVIVESSSKPLFHLYV